MDLLQTLLVYMSLVFTASVQTAPEPSVIPEAPVYASAYVEVTPVPSPVPTPVPTIAITPNPAYQTLQMGDRGELVRTMQEQLKKYGYYNGDIDGAYGNQTRKAVEYFQYMHGLTVDGIAGRHTLTVLYESSEIRLPPSADETPEPTAAVPLTVAITPTAAPDATLIPVLTSTPLPTSAPKPTAAPLPMEELQGYILKVNEASTALKAYQQGGTIYLPVVELLKTAGVNVITSTSVELDEYAFASGFTFVRFTHAENQQGQPVDLQLYRNDEPQLVPDRSLFRADDVLYMPLASFENITGMACAVKEKSIEITGSAE